MDGSQSGTIRGTDLEVPLVVMGMENQKIYLKYFF